LFPSISQFPDIWTDFCNRSGRAPKCGETSFYPTVPGMISQQGDLGVAGYVSQGFAEGAIGYVNYSYALGNNFPVAKVLNAAGFFTEPTPQNVAVSLLKAQINTDATNPAVYLTQQLAGVYSDMDPRNYQLSSYSYLILPTTIAGQFNADKGYTLGAFAYYAMCQAQQQSASLGYSPLPVNLVQAGFDQIRKIPGVAVQDIDIKACKNPTFAADGSNLLADSAPQPQACDQHGSISQCPNGTGGMSNVPTAVLAVVAATPTPAATTPAATTPAVGATPSAGATPAAGATPTAAADPGAAAGDATPAPAPAPGANPANGVTPAGGAAPAAGATPAGGATPVPGSATGAATASPVATGAPAPGAATAGAAAPVVTVPSAPTVTVPTAGAGGATPAAGRTCDVDTGVCGGGAASPSVAQVASSGAAAAGQASASPGVGAITATTLAQSGGNSSLFLVFLVVLLTIGLILAPALAWRRFSTTEPA
jgi:hypothetical protein